MPVTQRDNKYEMLRIIAMFFIVLCHFISQGGRGTGESALIKCFIIFFGSGAKVAVNIFLIISCWFMVDKEFKAERIVRTWYTVISYAVPISVVMLLINPNLQNVILLIKSFFPVFARPLWFASAYILLMLMIPFFNIMLRNIGKYQHAMLVVTLLIPCCLAATIMFHDDFLNDLIWFFFVYIFVFFIKRYCIDYVPCKSGILFTVAFLIYFCLCTTEFVCERLSFFIAGKDLSDILLNTARNWLSDIKALPNFLCALSIFFGIYGIRSTKKSGGG